MGKHALSLMFAAALALRIGYALTFSPAPAPGDASQYDAIGWRLASGGGFSIEPGVPTPVRAPGYPFFLAALYRFFGHSPLAALLAQALLGGLICLLIYDIAKRLFDERTALLGAWFTALFPVSVVYSGLLLSETLFAFLFILSIAFFARSEDGEKRGALMLSGAALGLATLTRPTTLLFPFGIGLALLASGARHPFKKLILVGLAFAVPIIPWTARNWSRFGVLLPVATGGATCLYATGRMAAGGTYEQGFEEITVKWEKFKASADFPKGLDPHISFDRRLKEEGVALIKAHPAGYAAVILKRIPKYWLSSHSSIFGVDKPLGEYYAQKDYFPIAVRAGLMLFHGLIFLSMLLGLFYAGGSLRKWAILPVILLYFNMHIFFDLCPRYFVPIFPYIFVFCAVTALKLRDKLPPPGGRRV
ncbi:MAG: glycosyltransferase family 39 protein [Elusimicrobia bacterium]|nr:glycosyltransferase family 39 protein [Elusimicrobiota bacterium]